MSGNRNCPKCEGKMILGVIQDRTWIFTLFFLSWILGVATYLGVKYFILGESMLDEIHRVQGETKPLIGYLEIVLAVFVVQFAALFFSSKFIDSPRWRDSEARGLKCDVKSYSCVKCGFVESYTSPV